MCSLFLWLHFGLILTGIYAFHQCVEISDHLELLWPLLATRGRHTSAYSPRLSRGETLPPGGHKWQRTLLILIIPLLFPQFGTESLIQLLNIKAIFILVFMKIIPK